MKQIIIEITAEQEKALLSDMMDIKEWLQNAINVKANRVICDFILNHTDKNPDKLSEQEKVNLINQINPQPASVKPI